jgi:hypothetical protein
VPEKIQNLQFQNIFKEKIRQQSAKKNKENYLVNTPKVFAELCQI